MDYASMIFAGLWFAMAQLAMHAKPKKAKKKEHVIHTGQAPNNVTARMSQ